MASREYNQTDAATRRFLRQAMQTPLLTRDREVELAARWLDDGDTAALHELISAHIRLVAGSAAGYRKLGLPMAELLQEGTLGLLQAANRFDPEREIRFSTYAGWWVRAQMQDYLLRNWSVVRVGSSTMQKRLFSRLRKAQAGSPGSSGLSEEQRQAIADELGVDRREVELMEAIATRSDRSFNAPVEDNGQTQLQDLIADDSPGPEEIVMDRRDLQIRSDWMRDAIGALPARERLIIHARYLADDPRTLKSLGEELGVSKERVRQLECAALRKIKDRMGNRDETTTTP